MEPPKCGVHSIAQQLLPCTHPYCRAPGVCRGPVASVLLPMPCCSSAACDRATSFAYAKPGGHTLHDRAFPSAFACLRDSWPEVPGSSSVRPSRTGNLVGQHLIASERTHEDTSALSLGCPALPYTSYALSSISVIVQAVFRFHPGGVGVTGGYPPPCRQLSA